VHLLFNKAVPVGQAHLPLISIMPYPQFKVHLPFTLVETDEHLTTQALLTTSIPREHWQVEFTLV
jgi:hypothetical protein